VTAAKEIKELIQDSVRKVQDGSLLVTQSGQTLEQIVLSVKKVSDIVAEIAAASREQSSGIEQVNKAVMQMDEMTQQNAALVEQATAASQSMADQARDLSKMMERYQIGESSAVGSSASRSAPARKVAPVGERRSPNRPYLRQACCETGASGTARNSCNTPEGSGQPWRYRLARVLKEGLSRTSADSVPAVSRNLKNKLPCRLI
jgi:methyl-accepting chemotaxis protein-like sensor